MEVINKLNYKLFIGCLITSEIRLHLGQSSVWNQAKITPSEKNLVETHFHDKDYLGLFLPENHINLNELKGIENQIITTLKDYLPQISSEKFKILVFSQLFIS